MIDLKHEIERELSLIDPPDLWDRIQADASNDGDGGGVELTTARHRRRPSLWLAVAAVTVLLALVGAVALLDDHQTIETTPATEPPANGDGPTTLARAEDVGIGASGQTLNIDAMQQAGEVTGEFRVNNVVVTVECAGTETDGRDLVPPTDGRDLILGGVVTDDPDGQGLVAGVGDGNAAVGDLVALIIRERGDGAKVVLYTNDSSRSCAELVESVPFNLDGGFFNGGGVGDGIETEPLSTTLAKAEDVEIAGVMGLGGKTLTIDAAEHNGEVTGEFRVNNLVVTLHCADTNGFGDLILGGEVTEDPDSQSLAPDPPVIGFDGIDVAVGDLLALLIREGDPAPPTGSPTPDRVSIYATDSAGSCTELVDAAAQRPTDGGFFDYVRGDIETRPEPLSP